MNYLKKFESFLYNESVEVKPGEILNLTNIGGTYLSIKAEVYLTEEVETAYHSGIIDDIDIYLENYALYVTKDKRSASVWNLGTSRRGYRFSRVYEVKIKKGSKFVAYSPAGLDNSIGLVELERSLIPLGIVGMTDDHFRNNNTHYGNTMDEGLIFDKSAIESFRVIPFREILDDKNLKETNKKIQKLHSRVSLKIFKENQEFYNDLKNKIESGKIRFPMWDAMGLSLIKNGKIVDDAIEWYLQYDGKQLQSKIDNIIESMSNKDLNEYLEGLI